MIALALLGCLAAAPADVVKQVDVRATPSDVWKAWTTAEGAKTFFAPDARIEPRVGGAFEISFDPSQPAGRRGSEGCTVIAVEPMKKLTFSWNFPPSLPKLRDAKATTTVTVELLPEGKTTRVRLTQTGFKDQPAWHEGRAYFERAWGTVLARLSHRYRRAPIDWKAPWSPVPGDALRFLEGTVVKGDGPEREQWSFTDAGLTGSAFAIEPDNGEWVLTLRLPTAGARLVLDSAEEDHAVFVSEFGEDMRVEYIRNGDALTMRVKTPSREETHVFKRR